MPPARRSSAAAARSRCSSRATCCSSRSCTPTRSRCSGSTRPRPARRGILTHLGFEFTGGITPQGLAVSPDGRTVYVANMQTEDVSFLGVERQRRADAPGLPAGRRDRQHARSRPKAATARTCSPRTRRSACAGCSRSRTRTMDRSRAGIATGRAATTAASGTSAPTRSAGRRSRPQNKDTSDNWPEWFEGLSNDMNSYASSCNGELINAERPTALFPQAVARDRLRARDEFVAAQDGRELARHRARRS